MADLIDRQAAIDALEEKYMSFGIFREQRAASQCIDVIKHLPSAQPLSAWGGNPLKIECETAQPERIGRWIPVTERLPKDGDEVLITAWKDTVFISWRSDGIWTCDSFFFDDSTEVSAWMPLPEPYKEVEE